ncbi:hypothetical protein HZF08_17630 [Paenibacillus sp. CGMCC 1.16610]|uniref:Uncharacterized protein n=1 Tax=Paenibacillus anseongense TaxID=2682845 RepID=A0ABW9UEL4_9BACL|nr:MULTISPECIES: CBO0543 family protein [Paenibacillus]MBA2940138.1 hypothetical protein [Paenibacillus sp. CGMCC 1.16610]MVQ38592.1 hypothetical protein [Paenibacillus anseongense]
MGHITELIVSYLPVIMALLCLIAAWLFGDWRNWKTYYPTILFAICVDFLVSLLSYNYSLWVFHKSAVTPNHTIADFMIAFSNLPCIVMVYLHKYPLKSRPLRQVIYIAIWSAVFTCVEGLFLLIKMLTYHNNWNFWWSIAVWVFMFIGLRLHFTRPLWAWLLCVAGVVFLILYFHIPIAKMK